MKNIRSYLIAFLCVGALLLSACAGEFDGSFSSVPEGKGVINLNMFDPASRAVVPDEIKGGQFTFKATFSTSAVIADVEDVPLTNNALKQELPFAEWKITVNAYLDDVLVGQAVLDPVTLSSSRLTETINNVFVLIRPFGEENGFLEWDITFPPKVEFALVYISFEGEQFSPISLKDPLDEYPLSLPPGSYRFWIDLTAYEDDQVRVAGDFVIVHIYPTLTTHAGTWVFTDEMFFDVREVDVTVAVNPADAVESVILHAEDYLPVTGTGDVAGTYSFSLPVKRGVNVIDNVYLTIHTGNTTLTTAVIPFLNVTDDTAEIPAITLYPLNVTAGANGSVKVDISGVGFTNNTTTVQANENKTFYLLGNEQNITVTANPVETFEVTSFTVTGATVSGNTHTFNMTAGAVNVSAVFSAIPVSAITVTTPTEGTLSTSPSGNVMAGTPVTVTLAHNPDRYDFVSLTIAETGGGGSLTPVPVPDETYKWTFEMPRYPVTISASLTPIYRTAQFNVSAGGTAAITGGFNQATMMTGDIIPLTITTDPNYRFGSIEVVFNSTHHAVINYEDDIPVSFVMPAGNVTISVEFVDVSIPRRQITTATVSGGTIAIQGNAQDQAIGFNVTVILTASDNWRYKSGSLTITDVTVTTQPETSDNHIWTYTFAMPGPAGSGAVNVTAEFERIFTVNTSVTGISAAGTLTADKTANLIAGDTVALTLTIPQPLLYKYKDNSIAISINGNPITPTGSSPSWTFTLPVNIATLAGSAFVINASVELEDVMYTVSGAGNVTNGNIQVSSASVKAGDTVTITLTPNANFYRYKTGTLSIDNAAATASLLDTTSPAGALTRTWTFTMPTANVTVAAEFERYLYALSIAVSGGNGHAGIIGSHTSAEENERVMISVEPEHGYKFNNLTGVAGWEDITINSDGPGYRNRNIVFEMPANDVSITVTFTAVIVTEVSIGTGDISLAKGTASQALTPAPTPSDAIVSTTVWETRNTSIATVDNGVVTAVEVGETAVWVTINGVKSNERIVKVTHVPLNVTIDFDIHRDAVFVITGLPSGGAGHPVLTLNQTYNLTLTGHSIYDWYLNGQLVGSNAGYTLNTTGLLPGFAYEIAVVVTVGGHKYSKEIVFTVQP